MISRNGGRLTANEKVYINNEPLVEISCYKNLGICFFSRLCWSTRTLASQADKAIYTIQFINREYNGLPVQLLFD